MRPDEERTLRLGDEILKPFQLRRVYRPLDGSHVPFSARIRPLQRVKQDNVGVAKRNDACKPSWNLLVLPVRGPILQEIRPSVVIAHRQEQFDSRVNQTLQHRL